MDRLRGPVALALASVFAACGGNHASGQSDERLDLAVKATFLYKVAPFVDWPASVSEAGGDFEICVAGADPFGAVLDRAAAGQHVDGRPIVVRRVAVAGPNTACRIMFIGGSPRQPIKAALQILEGTPVLTVTDDADTKGMIDFAVVGGRVRFTIDDALAEKSGLFVSSKLSRLALRVKARPASDRR